MAHFSSEEQELLNKLVNSSPISGKGTPEGKVVAHIGRLYIDIEGLKLWIKGPGSGSEGWIES